MREQALLHGSFGSLLLTTGISAAIPLGMRMRAEAKKKVAVRQVRDENACGPPLESGKQYPPPRLKAKPTSGPTHDATDRAALTC
jgi:hypothetical protein